jgi:hypothetical protein
MITLAMSFLTFKKALSLIPVLGVISCSFLLSEIESLIWIRFGWWLLLGLAIYFSYGVRKSHLNKKNQIFQSE